MSIHNGYEKGFDFCLDKGKDGERLAHAALRHLTSCESCLVEVKTDFGWFNTGNIYVECKCRGRDGIWRDSGIVTTEAHLWVVVFSDTQAFWCMPARAMRVLAEKAWKDGRRAPHRYGENPTWGALVSLADLPALVGALPFDDIEAAPVGSQTQEAS